MSETVTATSAQNEWVKAALGLDVDRGGFGEPDAQGERPPARKFPFFGKKAAKTEETATEPTGGGDAPTDKDVVKKLKALADEIAALKTKTIDMTQLEADAADFSKQAVSAEKMTDEKAKKTSLTALKKRLDEALAHAKALSKAVKDLAGKEAPNDEQKNKAYQKVLKEFYGLKIDVPAGMTNTHFDKVFDMFGSVPKDHVKQSKLKKLKYKDETGYGGVYYYSDNSIEMGDFGDATGEEEYEIDGEKMMANSFNVTTLHEVGHSLDDKHKIMDTSQGKAGCGGWKQETQASVATALVTELKSAGGFSDKVTNDMLNLAVNTALDAGTTEQPDTIEDDDWQKILPFLVDHCLPIRDDAQPYFKSDAVASGDRVFTESSKGWWYSYAKAARGSTKVNNYQWRSPAEWFAEVYAISWLKKKKPPTGVDAAAAKYMWKG